MNLEMAEIFPMYEDLNFTELNNTHWEICPPAIDRGTLLQAMCTLYVFIFIVGLAANALVVWVNVRAEHHRHETHLYILNLAVADLCVVATLPVWVSSLAQAGHWPFGQAACKLTHLIFSVNLFASIFFLACMSMDRYLSVTRFGDAPCRRKRLVRRLVCAGAWLLALVASMPDTYFLRAVKIPHADATHCCPMYPEESQQEWMASIQLSFVVLGFAVPFPVIAVSYALLASALSSSAASPTSSSAGDHERSLSRKVIFTYIVVFLLCWAPYHVVLLMDALVLLGTLPLTCAMENALYVGMNLTQCLSLLHCCVNPVVYSFIHRHYRYDLMKAFIFKYSTRTGIARLMDNSNGVETEYSAVENPSQL
ncbi:atypical chemokine receptor 3a [Clupea harengus]|uniref:Atypical chemokine receptor 3a n=1 Tax=Clupea harengus TaxID=7950 RepID=A0A6P8GXB6_CLUHA|nr:atypical chemokine receptor 3a [Clupea harengus]XP_031440127.1 atypical chemokine receptor 3a [Clupea harengus]